MDGEVARQEPGGGQEPRSDPSGTGGAVLVRGLALVRGAGGLDGNGCSPRY